MKPRKFVYLIILSIIFVSFISCDRDEPGNIKQIDIKSLTDAEKYTAVYCKNGDLYDNGRIWREYDTTGETVYTLPKENYEHNQTQKPDMPYYPLSIKNETYVFLYSHTLNNVVDVYIHPQTKALLYIACDTLEVTRLGFNDLNIYVSDNELDSGEKLLEAASTFLSDYISPDILNTLTPKIKTYYNIREPNSDGTFTGYSKSSDGFKTLSYVPEYTEVRFEVNYYRESGGYFNIPFLDIDIREDGTIYYFNLPKLSVVDNYANLNIDRSKVETAVLNKLYKLCSTDGYMFRSIYWEKSYITIVDGVPCIFYVIEPDLLELNTGNIVEGEAITLLIPV